MFVYSATGGLTQPRTTRAPRVPDSESSGESLNPGSTNFLLCTRLPEDSLDPGPHEHLESHTRSHRENHSIPDICDHNHGRRSSRPSLDWVVPFVVTSPSIKP